MIMKEKPKEDSLKEALKNYNKNIQLDVRFICHALQKILENELSWEKLLGEENRSKNKKW